MPDILHDSCRSSDLYRFPDAPGDLVPVYIGTVHRAFDFHVRRSRRPSTSGLALVAAGHGSFTCGGADLVLSPGMVYASAVGSPLEVRCAPEAPMVVHLLAVRGAGFPALVERELGTASGAWRIANPSELLRLFDLLRDEARAAQPLAGEIGADLVRALVRTIRRGLATGPTTSVAYATFLRARTELECDPTNPPSLSALARRLGISAMHLNRVFRRFAGRPPAAWLRDRRLDLAAARLDGGATIASIASDLGWSDPYAFSRAFRRRHGQAPTHWRNGFHPA